MVRQGFRVSPVVIVFIVWAMMASAFATPAQAQVANLRDQLEKGLKARVPADFAFIDTVVTMVENKQLPLSLVRSTFLWVRKNRGYKRYMMFYFQQVLRKRALQKGITIP